MHNGAPSGGGKRGNESPAFMVAFVVGIGRPMLVDNV